jgi:hypothetical protein
MFKNKKIRWITQTAIFTALLIVLQSAAAQLGNQFITGSVVNLIIIVSTVLCGFMSAAAVSCAAAVLIRVIGLGNPFWILVPFIILGNLTLAAVWHIIGRREKNIKIAYPIALVTAAVCKFAVLYLSVVKFAAPVLLGLPSSAPVVLAYSFPQLITAGIGGAAAIAILPVIKKAIKHQE